MKKFASLVMALVVTVLFSANLTLAEIKEKKVEFNRDVVVNGTIVKKGKYTVKFDDQTNEMTILKGDKVVAKSNARKGLRNVKATTTEIMVVRKDNDSVLKGIILEGDKETILLSNDTVNTSPQ
jgi:ethanolamine utilization cobalamin adenosyltransferase